MVLAVALVVGAAVAGVVGWTWSRGTGVLRPGSLERIAPHDVALAPEDYGAVATLLLFTSAADDRAGSVRGALHRLAGPGVRVAEVDLGARGDLAGRYAVTRTPSVFALDAEQRLRARVKGPAPQEVLAAALAAALPRAD